MISDSECKAFGFARQRQSLCTPETRRATFRIALTHLSPYQLGGGVNRESVFFGRREMLAHILNREPNNYLVADGRQLGKSSLLKALDRRLQEQGTRSIYLSLTNRVLIPRLAAALGLGRDAGLEGIAASCGGRRDASGSSSTRRTSSVRYEQGQGYAILNALRSLSEEGRCSFILAGFRDLYQHAVLDYQSPLKNFGELREIGPLEPEASRDLATLPMRSMRLEYASPALMEEIINRTGRRANLIGIACHEIVSGLEAGRRVIEAGDVHRALHGDKVRNALKGWESAAEEPADQRLDRLAVYATVSEGRFRYGELVERLQGLGGRVESARLDRALERLTLGFVLGREGGGKYFYRVPLFREFLLEDDLETRLRSEAEENS